MSAELSQRWPDGISVTEGNVSHGKRSNGVAGIGERALPQAD